MAYKRYNLGFMSDEQIYEHVKNTVLQYKTFIDLKEFNKNILDPIKLTFDAKVYGKTFEEIIESECHRQIDKANTNSYWLLSSEHFQVRWQRLACASKRL